MRVFHKSFILLPLLTLALAAPRAGFAALTISEIASQTTFNQSSSAQTGNVLVYLTATGSDITNDLFAGQTVSASVLPASGSGLTIGTPSVGTGNFFGGAYPYIFASGSGPGDSLTGPFTAYVTDNTNNLDSSGFGGGTVYGNTGVDDVKLPGTGVVGLMEFPFTIQPNATGVFTIALDSNSPGSDLLAVSLLDPGAKPYPDSLTYSYGTFNTAPGFGPALSISVVPEPSTLMLAAIAAGGGMFWGCRRWRTSRVAV